MSTTQVRGACQSSPLNNLTHAAHSQTDLPNVFVVGAAKSGTTALYHYFAEHPQVFVPAAIKETNYMAFFDRLPAMQGPGDQTVVGKSVTSLQNYRELYRNRAGEMAAADVSPAYLYYHQRTARKIFELNRHAKIVIVLRNPIEATFSMYAMMRRDGREPCRTFWEAFQSSPERLAAGWEWAWDYQHCFKFARQVSSFLERFPAEQLFIRPYESLKKTPEKYYRELTNFLGIAPIDTTRANRRVNTSPRQLDMLSRQRLGRLLIKAAKAASYALPSSLTDRVRAKFEQPAFTLGREDRLRLIDHFGPDICELSRLVNFCVADWLKAE